MKYTITLIFLLSCLAQLNGQGSFDIKKMQAQYEKRQARLDTMLMLPQGDYEPWEAKTTDGVSIAGWFMKANGNETVLMVHGFMMNKSHMLSRANTFVNAGYNVLLVDLRARGESGGDKTSDGTESAKDLMAMIRLFYARFPNKPPLYLYGFSHGCRALIYTAQVMDKPVPMILESPPYSLTNSFKRTYKMPNVPNLDGEGLDPILKEIADFPMLVLVGDKDSAITKEEAEHMISFSRHQDSQMASFENTAHDVHVAKNLDQFRKVVFSMLKATEK